MQPPLIFECIETFLFEGNKHQISELKKRILSSIVYQLLSSILLVFQINNHHV